MKFHHLKIYPSFFIAVESDRKKSELRLNDRNFKVGDCVELLEFTPSNNKCTGRCIVVIITHVLENVPGLETGYCIFSFLKYKSIL